MSLWPCGPGAEVVTNYHVVSEIKNPHVTFLRKDRAVTKQVWRNVDLIILMNGITHFTSVVITWSHQIVIFVFFRRLVEELDGLPGGNHENLGCLGQTEDQRVNAPKVALLLRMPTVSTSMLPWAPAPALGRWGMGCLRETSVGSKAQNAGRTHPYYMP